MEDNNRISNGGRGHPIGSQGSLTNFIVKKSYRAFGLLGGLFMIVLVLTLNTSDVFAQTDSPQQTNGLNGSNVCSAASDVKGKVFAGTQNGIYQSTDNGKNWTNVNGNSGMENSYVWSICIAENGHLFAGTYGKGIYRSTDSGNSWTQLSSGMAGYQNCAITSLAIDKNGDVLAGTDGYGLYKSNDDGNTWSQTDSGLTTNRIYSIHADSNGNIFAGTVNGIFRSTDNGSGWKAIGLSGSAILSIAVNSKGDIFVGTYVGICRSTNNGSSWTSVNSGLTNTYVWSLIANQSGCLYAGTYGNGVCCSTDNGNSWTQTNLGADSTAVLSFAVSTNGLVFIGTFGAGIIGSSEPAITNAQSSSTNVPSTFKLYQNYPNPFNPTTTITYDIPATTHVQVIVYDILGREVRSLIDKEQQPGSYKVELDGSSLASGVYFCRLIAGSFAETKKLALLK